MADDRGSRPELAVRPERGGERGAGTHRERAAQLAREAALGQPCALQQRRARDHRQRDVAREPVCVLTGEVAQAGSGKRGAVARDAGDERASLRDSKPQRVAGPGVVVTARLRTPIGDCHHG